jgi:predicted GNAT family N-acyltransferase
MENIDLKKLEWTYFKGSEVQASLLQSICLFRSFVLYDAGFRKDFGQHGSSFGDIQYSDFESYHVVAFQGSEIVGTVRITPATAETVASSVLGEAGFNSLLHRLVADKKSAVEINRLMIDERFRKQKLGQTLMYAAVALVDHLWKSENMTIIGTAGNCTKQTEFFLKYTDYRRIEGLQNQYAEKFNDEVTFLEYGSKPYRHGVDWVEFFANQFSLARDPLPVRLRTKYQEDQLL